MDTSAIHVSLKELTLRGGERYERCHRIEMAPIVLGGQRYEVLIPDGVTLVVDCIAGGFLVSVSLAASLYGSCDRCLREAKLEVRAKEREFVPTTKDGWDESELSPFIEDFIVDVSGLAREATVLALPSQVVCSAKPRLCPVCGYDRNAGPCECPAGATDERWMALKDLRLEE
jgi:uncharacterized metal-binding protein YceD (DUF177 family)